MLQDAPVKDMSVSIKHFIVILLTFYSCFLLISLLGYLLDCYTKQTVVQKRLAILDNLPFKTTGFNVHAFTISITF